MKDVIGIALVIILISFAAFKYNQSIDDSWISEDDTILIDNQKCNSIRFNQIKNTFSFFTSTNGVPTIGKYEKTDSVLILTGENFNISIEYSINNFNRALHLVNSKGDTIIFIKPNVNVDDKTTGDRNNIFSN